MLTNLPTLPLFRVLPPPPPPVEKSWLRQYKCQKLSLLETMYTILTHYTVRPNKKETRFYQWDICIATQDLIKLYASLSRAFSLLLFDTKDMMISQCMNEKEQFKLMRVKFDLRRIMVLSWYDQVQTSESMSE